MPLVNIGAYWWISIFSVDTPKFAGLYSVKFPGIPVNALAKRGTRKSGAPIIDYGR